MSRLRVLIVDDERLARQKIVAMLAAHPDVVMAGECADGAEAVSQIRTLAPDIVFLDIQMPGQNGFDVLRKLKGSALPAIVFVTAHDEYAIRAFDVEAVDYLLKPFDRRRFDEALRRARRRIELGNSESAVPERLLAAVERLAGRSAAAPHWNRFVVRLRDRMTFVSTSDIDWIESEGKYVRLHSGPTSHLVRQSIGDVERRLDPAEFARIHRRFIVNLRKVTEIYRGVQGEYVVALSTRKTLTVSRRYWSKIRHLGGVS